MNQHLFWTVFVMIFLAELPDKTAFASILMATRQSPWSVFVGACLAFVIQSLVAVFFGSIFGLLPSKLVHIATGVLFLAFAIFMWRREEEDEESENFGGRISFWKGVGSSFMVIFVAEWGDLTQLATASFVAKFRAPVIIFFSATLALWTVTAISVLVGTVAKKKINAFWLQRAAAIAFAFVGLYFLATSR